MDGLTAFQPPPENMLSEQIDLPTLYLSLGLVHPEGSGVRIVAWSGAGISHMSPAKARRLAKEMRATPQALELLPAIRGLEALANRADELATPLASMVVEGAG
jgi:hypothetical protein